MKLELNFEIVSNEDLAPADRKLREAALDAAWHAYAPYSHFQVGAAVELADVQSCRRNSMSDADNGAIIKLVCGSNQENIAYPSGLCAERVALFAAAANFPDTPPTTLAVIAIKDGVVQKYISPCGACRQVMLEIEQRYNQPLRVLLCGSTETLVCASASDLLPLAFNF